jgi:hypothetical protein
MVEKNENTRQTRSWVRKIFCFYPTALEYEYFKIIKKQQTSEERRVEIGAGGQAVLLTDEVVVPSVPVRTHHLRQRPSLLVRNVFYYFVLLIILVHFWGRGQGACR